MALAVVSSRTDDAGSDAPRQRPGVSLQAAMIDEIFANATEDQALSFFMAVGARLASSHAPGNDDGLSDLEREINTVWREAGLGQVTLTVVPDGIAIDHQGYAASEAGRSAWWPKAADALLRGAYSAWFAALGGAGKLHIRHVRQTGERILFHYGL